MLKFQKRWKNHRALDEVPKSDFSKEQVKFLKKNNIVVELRKEADNGNSMG